jgi:hypothetical protein
MVTTALVAFVLVFPVCTATALPPSQLEGTKKGSETETGTNYREIESSHALEVA